jgi:hypothetical protein
VQEYSGTTWVPPDGRCASIARETCTSTPRSDGACRAETPPGYLFRDREQGERTPSFNGNDRTCMERARERPSPLPTRPERPALPSGRRARRVLVFALYAITLAPTTAFWDTSEYIATGAHHGHPAPAGESALRGARRAWELLLAPLGLSVAVRINLFSAFMSALAHGLWFLVVHHILTPTSPDRRFRLVGAFAAVLVSATAFTVWNQSNVNEKVYTVSCSPSRCSAGWPSAGRRTSGRARTTTCSS